jgi:hypothetical protein
VEEMKQYQLKLNQLIARQESATLIKPQEALEEFDLAAAISSMSIAENV